MFLVWCERACFVGVGAEVAPQEIISVRSLYYLPVVSTEYGEDSGRIGAWQGRQRSAASGKMISRH